ncbi:MAG: M14 metallopeptidase family protein [Bacteroidota bacterium]
MKNRLLFILLCALPLLLSAQSRPDSYYLPDNVSYNAAIPTPASVLGYQIGDWHVSHDQLVMYMRTLAESSDRISLEEYARSYENRPLLLLKITSPANQGRLEQIQQQHQANCDPERAGELDLNTVPAVLYQGFTIHGNEASGINAALMVAYYLAAAQGPTIEDLLNKVVILLDPCLNPDGAHRFSTWVNMHKSKNLTADPADREYDESWPRGRTNHYWFDLNRDWLLTQHPESQGRIRSFHRWKPNVLTDHHEMGRNATFFFQPGVPSRTHPYTPARNQELTHQIAAYHAKALDEIGSLYYSEENFDDFYYGKGSTYPDANGGIGILFEQASSRGHLQETVNGELSFPFTIRNQFATALSSIEATYGLRKELLEFQRDFYKTAKEEANRANTKAYVFHETQDPARLRHFIQLLQQHQIEVFVNKADARAEGKTFKGGQSYVVPVQQPQYRLIKSLFEPMTDFKDSLFYDVSTWTMPMAFNIEYAAMKGSVNKGKAVVIPSTLFSSSSKEIKSDYAYCFEWDAYYAPKLLNAILKSGLRAKVANEPFRAKTVAAGTVDFNRGSIAVPVQNQQLGAAEIQRLINEAANSSHVQVYGIESGLTPSGIDMGSPSYSTLKKPEVLLMVGDGVSSYDAGEVWHLLDQRYDMSLAKVESDRMDNIDLNRYTCIVMVNGSYGLIEKRGVTAIKDWVRKGGTLIVMKRALNWAKANGLAGFEYKTPKENRSKKSRAYGSRSRDRGAQFIGGAIFEAQLDLTHPLTYGYRRATLPVFRQGTTFIKPTRNKYASPLVYSDDPLLSGYVSKRNLETIKNSVSVVVSGIGSGKVICFSDNPNFRAFWYGTNKLFANAIFFGSTINNGTRERASSTKEEEEEEAAEGHHHHH